MIEGVLSKMDKEEVAQEIEERARPKRHFQTMNQIPKYLQKGKIGPRLPRKGHCIRTPDFEYYCGPNNKYTSLKSTHASSS